MDVHNIYKLCRTSIHLTEIPTMILFAWHERCVENNLIKMKYVIKRADIFHLLPPRTHTSTHNNTIHGRTDASIAYVRLFSLLSTPRKD